MPKKPLEQRILRLETSIEKKTKKLARLKQKLAAAATAQPAARKQRLTPEGRAKLSATMKARWVAKKQAATAGAPAPGTEN